MLIRLLLVVVGVTTAQARDGFKIGQTGQRVSLQENLPRFKESRTRLRGVVEPAFKIARALGTDSLQDTSSFKERLTTLKASKAGNQLLNRLAQRMQSSALGGWRNMGTFRTVI